MKHVPAQVQDPRPLGHSVAIQLRQLRPECSIQVVHEAWLGVELPVVASIQLLALLRRKHLPQRCAAAAAATAATAETTGLHFWALYRRIVVFVVQWRGHKRPWRSVTCGWTPVALHAGVMHLNIRSVKSRCDLWMRSCRSTTADMLYCSRAHLMELHIA